MERWWIYQKERFPLIAYAILVAALVLAPLGLGNEQLFPSPPSHGTWSIAATFVVTFMMFALLRIADEFKDYEEDLAFRAYRPVPRGLISLMELKYLAIILLCCQLILTALLGWQALLALFALWSYWALMSKEFFAGQWLSERPLWYLFSHMLLMPILALYILASLGLAATLSNYFLGCWLMGCWLAGLLLEIGRKIRHCDEEETGVQSYSKLWGKHKALVIWLSIAGLWLSVLAMSSGLSGIALLVFLLTCATAWLFKANKIAGKRLEDASSALLLIGFAMMAMNTL